MLTRSQMLMLALVSLGLWIVATAYIRLLPGALGGLRGDLSFLTTFLFAWLSVRLVRWAARLERSQLMAGVGVAGALAMMIDGAVLRWLPQVYGSDERVLRLGAAWLLWGYGVSFAVAVVMSAPRAADAKNLVNPGR